MEVQLTDNINPYLESEGQAFPENPTPLDVGIDTLEQPVVSKKKNKESAGFVIEERKPVERPEESFIVLGLHRALPKTGEVIAFNYGQGKVYKILTAQAFYANKNKFAESEWRSLPES